MLSAWTDSHKSQSISVVTVRPRRWYHRAGCPKHEGFVKHKTNKNERPHSPTNCHILKVLTFRPVFVESSMIFSRFCPATIALTCCFSGWAVGDAAAFGPNASYSIHAHLYNLFHLMVLGTAVVIRFPTTLGLARISYTKWRCRKAVRICFFAFLRVK